MSNKNDDSFVQLKIASPEQIKKWSYGEVTKSETINYRTQQSERHGLFDPAIFGSDKDYECSCGKYKGIRYKGITCDRCGVEVTSTTVRRSRMGHISLATVVSHPWFLHSSPSVIAAILGFPQKDIEHVIYFVGYMVVEVDEKERKKKIVDIKKEYEEKLEEVKLKKEKSDLKDLFTKRLKELEGISIGQVMGEEEYYKNILLFSSVFKADIGPEVIYELIKNIDLKKLETSVKKQLEKASASAYEKIQKRLSVIKSLISSSIHPSWMFFKDLPVIPPGLRPMVPLEGGNYATSDINDLYRRIINRNKRLKSLLSIGAPEVIIRNEKRILQEAVDALIDNSLQMRSSTQSARGSKNNKELKSLTSYLGSKKGFFRGNLLGKRVDYSARAVIVAGPELSLNEVGIPKKMALELFKPFVVASLLKDKYANNLRHANRIIDESNEEVWTALEQVVLGKYVFLIRQPTLHKLSLLAYKPILIEENVIQLHPLVCSGYNADFDGDQMNVFLPLSEEAQMEAKDFLNATSNILNPSSGNIAPSPTDKDMILGLYWMTKIKKGAKGEGKYFSSPNEAIAAYEHKHININTEIHIQPTNTKRYAAFKNKLITTSVGRLFFNLSLPEYIPFINETLSAGLVNKTLKNIVVEHGAHEVVPVLDKIKTLGFENATISGISYALSDIQLIEKKDLIEEGRKKAEKIMSQYNEGLITKNERVRLVVENWQYIQEEINKKVRSGKNITEDILNMIESKSRGDYKSLGDSIGMKGIISNTKGQAIETPITASYKEGLNPIEYFVEGYAARKGLTDTALKTADGGYLTRKIIYVTQDVKIIDTDCGSKTGFIIYRQTESGLGDPFDKRVEGRYAVQDITIKKKVIVKAGECITYDASEKIGASDLDSIVVRSPISCLSHRGICQKCYGNDYATNNKVDMGEPVGVIAAQSIGEPGTQLTLNTVHLAGSISTVGDITSGLNRVTQLLERRVPRYPASIARIDGTVSNITTEENTIVVELTPSTEGKTTKKDEVYTVVVPRRVLVKKGNKVKKGDFLTDGDADIVSLFEISGAHITQEYIFNQISKIYELQGRRVMPKYLEIVLRQMFMFRKITDAGDAVLSVGDVVENDVLKKLNKELKAAGKQPIMSQSAILGITEISKNRESFLVSASFQHTRKALIKASIKASRDDLSGFVENTILGNLIPTGTGFPGSQKFSKMAKLKEKIQIEINEDKIRREEERRQLSRE